MYTKIPTTINAVNIDMYCLPDCAKAHLFLRLLLYFLFLHQMEPGPDMSLSEKELEAATRVLASLQVSMHQAVMLCGAGDFHITVCFLF